jgi:hypothetical protein
VNPPKIAALAAFLCGIERDHLGPAATDELILAGALRLLEDTRVHLSTLLNVCPVCRHGADDVEALTEAIRRRAQ